MNVATRHVCFAGIYLGRDIKLLRQRLRETPLRNSGIIAPDVSRLKEFGFRFVTETLITAQASLTAVSFHQYYMDGRNATWQKLIKPEMLDSLGYKIKKCFSAVKVLGELRNRSCRKKNTRRKGRKEKPQLKNSHRWEVRPANLPLMRVESSSKTCVDHRDRFGLRRRCRRSFPEFRSSSRLR